MFEKLNKASKKRLAIVGLIVSLAVIIAVGSWFGGDLYELFASQERIERTVEDAGAWGPVVFMLMQMLQVLVAPIPGQITGIAAGYLFGALLGTIYAMLGAVIGFTIIFVLARKLGRPAVEYFVDKRTLKKFDYLADTDGLFALFLIFLLPFFPDDFICYIAGLTTIPLRRLILVAFLGRLPGMIIFTFAGQNIAGDNLRLVVYLSLVALALAILIWLQRAKLERLVRQLSGRDK